MSALPEKLATYYRDARWRARRRKSAWNLLLFPLCFGAWIAIWYTLFMIVWAFHLAIYPDHRFAEFWPRGIGAGSFALSFLMVFAPMPAAMALGFILGDVLVWLVPAARRKLDGEARNYPGTSFSETISTLAKFCLSALPIGITVALAAAYFLSSLR